MDNFSRMYKVAVKINKRLDKQMCHFFIGSKIGNLDFGKERIIDIHPKLKSARDLKKKERNRTIDLYIDEYYKKNRKDIERSKEKMREAWKEIEIDYFEEVEKLFENKIYLKNRSFTSYLSIFLCSPLIDPQSWQVYYKITDPREIRRLFAHEIMHYLYYSYIRNEKKVKKHYENLNKESMWTKAELFNVVVLNQKQFRKLTGTREKGYEMHAKYFRKFNGIWNSSKGLDEYLVKAAVFDVM